MKPQPVRAVYKHLSLSILVGFAVSASAQSYNFPVNGRFVIPAPAGSELLKQCSRPAPSKVEGFWDPSPQDIEELEASLGKYLQKRRAHGMETPPNEGAYHRQYIGFTAKVGPSQKPERFIYGNFYPESAVHLPRLAINESTEPLQVCDGGRGILGNCLPRRD